MPIRTIERGRFTAAALALVLGIGATTACDRPASAQVGVSEHVRLVQEYVEAFNTGHPDTLAAVLDGLYAPAFLATFGDANSAARDRLELFRTYGPVDLHNVDTVTAPPIVWTQGRITRGWVGHQFYLADGPAPKVTRHSVWRARPVPYPQAALGREEIADSMRQYLDQLAGAGLFSGSLVLSQHGRRVLADSWGSDGQPVEAPVNGGTRFHTASVTKLLTATALLQLVEAGRVRLDDPIGRWIPEYPSPYRDAVLVHHLLTHTSGIELDDEGDYLAAIRVARTADDLLQAQIRHIRDREPPFPPGSEYDYTSEGFDLAGVIIERVTGRAWTEVVQERVLAPADMQATRYAVPRREGEWALGRTSLGPDLQTTIPGTLRPALDVLPVVAKPSAGIWSTAEDLHGFMRAVLDHRLLSAAWADSLLTPRLQTGSLPKYGIDGWVGLGAQGEDLWGTRTVGHGGVVPGYSAAIEYLPHNGWLLTVVSNTGEATGFLVFQRFLELVAHAAP